MPEVPYFLFKKLGFLRIKLFAGFSELLEHFPQVKQVLFERAANHGHFQIHETGLLKPLKTVFFDRPNVARASKRPKSMNVNYHNL
jgi:hypothetical protein